MMSLKAKDERVWVLTMLVHHLNSYSWRRTQFSYSKNLLGFHFSAGKNSSRYPILVKTLGTYVDSQINQKSSLTVNYQWNRGFEEEHHA